MNTFSKNYIKKFWVGLMDGDGSIQVNHWKHKYLQYRLVIKLKHVPGNLSMFHLFQTHIGGRVRTDSRGFILWSVDSRQSFFEILKIFDKYPPLTARLRAQIKFAYMCKEHNKIDIYLQTRQNKYLLFENPFTEPCSISNNTKRTPEPPVSSYFNQWLSGFIEAQGCFCIRRNNTKSFSLKNQVALLCLVEIKKHLGIQSSIRHLKNNIWFVETFRKTSLEKLEQHLIQYPLLGDKSQSFHRFQTHSFATVRPLDAPTGTQGSS